MTCNGSRIYDFDLKKNSYDDSMNRIDVDEDRENRITYEAVVDAYGPEERSMGWYYYLDDKINFPFQAKCISHQRTSPLSVEDRVTVVSMAPEEECDHDMFVDIEWNDQLLSVPLSQIGGIDLDEESEEAISDWHYWVGRGYEF